MSLLKRRTNEQMDQIKDMYEIEFRKVVQQSKRRSTSSIFSKRDYPVHECAMNSGSIVKVPVKCYNIIIKNNHFLTR